MTTQLADIPGPPALPLVGNVLQIPKDSVVQYLVAVSRDYPGIFRLWLPSGPQLFVYSRDLVAEISDESRFRKVVRGAVAFLRDVGGDGLFTAHTEEPNWGKAHRVLMPAFGQRAMKRYFDGMLEIARELVRAWDARAGGDVLVAADMTRLTLDTISLTGFGYRFNSFATARLHPFLEAMGRVLTEAMAKSTRLPLQNRFVSQKRYRTDIALMNRLVDDLIRRRRAHPVDEPDLLNLMLNAVDSQTGERLDDLNIRYQVITFLVAGHETTSGLLTFALYFLLRHPQVLAQAYAEVDRVLPGDTAPTYADLGRLDVIERVLKETLRLWPTAPAFALAPYEDTVIGGRYFVRKDRSLWVLLPSLHRDPGVWTDPETFDIDRFLPEAEAALPRHAYKPFGNGRRACIGRQFALTEAKLALAIILQNFALSDPHDYRLEIRESLTLKPEAFHLRARRRRPHERNTTVAAGDPLRAAPQAVSPAPHAGAGPFTVLYGTSLGTCREVAEQVEQHARHLGFITRIAPMDEYAEDLPPAGVLAVVTATYNGEAPDSARETAARIACGAFAAVKRPHLRYAVLGCGNSQWPNYQEFAKRIDAVLQRTGATAVLARAEADGNGNFDAAVEHWMNRLWLALGDAGADRAPEPPSITLAYAADDARAATLPAGVHTLSVTSNVELVRDPTGLWDFAREAPRASVRHIRLQLPAGVDYRTGDHLSVYPRNRPELVDAVAARLGVDPGAVVVLQGDTGRAGHLPLGKPVTVAQLLAEFVELQEPAARADVRRLIAHAGCADTRTRLERLVADDEPALAYFEKEITDKRVSVFTLLARFAAVRLPLATFLETCSAIRPRLYSISSSALVAPREVSLTVGAPAIPAGAEQGRYHGVGSAYLRSLAPGDRVFGLIRRPDQPFAPPDDAGTPMILVGPGTGFAPFRAFLQERAAQREGGADVARSLVFYGCRHPQHDWFYESEMRGWEEQGIAEVHLAFSTLPSHPYRFVQDALWAKRDAVWHALDAGATIYVCGDGRLMAPAVRDTLIRIYMEHRHATHGDASDWLRALIDTGRYRQDVFSDS